MSSFISSERTKHMTYPWPNVSLVTLREKQEKNNHQYILFHHELRIKNAIEHRHSYRQEQAGSQICPRIKGRGPKDHLSQSQLRRFQ